MIIEMAAAVFVFLAVTAVAMTILRPAHARAVEQRFEAWRTPMSKGLTPGTILKRPTSALPFLRSVLADSTWSQRAVMNLEQAGWQLKASEYLLLRLIVAAVTGILPVLITRGEFIGLALAVLFGAIGFMLPAVYVHLLKERRAAAISRQLVEALQLISNALRSGFAFTQAIEMAVEQLRPPLRDELKRFLHESGLGSSVEDALQAMTQRSGSYDLEMAVTAILVQRTTGGNLTEVLDNVAETMRERDRIQGEIRSLTASQRFTGLVLSIYPAALALLFFAIAPSQMSVLLTDPLGRLVLAIAGGLQLVGAFSIRRILDIDI